jgi:DNA-directed RNA polymerase subunit beta'
MSTTLGQEMLREIVPEDMWEEGADFNKKYAKKFFKKLAEEHPEEYVDIQKKMMDLSRIAITDYGDITSPSLNDLRLPPKAKEYRNKIRSQIYAIQESDTLSPEKKNEAVVNLMRKEMPKIQKAVEDSTFTGENSIAESIRHGFRGSPVQLTQLLFGDMLVADQKGQAIPVPGMHGYGEGVTPMEYWSGAYGSRKGYMDVQFMTAKSGFLGKQLALAAQRVQVTEDDCGADTVGTLVSTDDEDALGSVLARDVKDLPAGTAIEKKHLRKLQGQKLLVRSHQTCQSEQGVCSQCSGKGTYGKFPKKGDYLGVDTGRLLSEPLTQTGLSSKHSGGIIKGKQFAEELTGFDEIQQFLQVPKNFRGASALAPKDGVITAIQEAPQGGNYVMMSGGNRLYVPTGKKVLVNKGDKVEAGDSLSEGTPNPAELVKLKGLGEGRLYFARKFGDLLRDNGINVRRRHIDTMSRAFFDRVKITRPEGVGGHAIGQVVPYSGLQREYKARQDAQDLRPSRSIGQFLEKPVLHYSIGTRITPKAAKFMEEQKIKAVTVHQQDPGFEPAPMRLMDIPGSGETNWKNMLTGFHLKKNLLNAAREGAEAKHTDVGYAAKIMDPTQF